MAPAVARPLGSAMGEQTVSIVVATRQNLDGLDACLESLEGQRHLAAEIIVVSTVRPAADQAGCPPWVRWLYAEPEALIPQLWQKGIDGAQGDVVAITTAHFVPAADWVSQIRDAHGRLDSPAIGGAIDPPRGGGAVDWATYFLRYSAYLSWHREETVTDLAGDNASYKRTALAAHRGTLHDGFWEADVHRLMLAEGKTLIFAPTIRVTQRTSFGFSSFCRQRLHHGRTFGRARVRGCRLAERVVRVGSSPLTPLVFLAKILVRVARDRRDWGAFLYSLPVLVCFLSAWTVGEWWGYVSTTRPDASAAPGEKRITT